MTRRRLLPLSGAVRERGEMGNVCICRFRTPPWKMNTETSRETLLDVSKKDAMKVLNKS